MSAGTCFYGYAWRSYVGIKEAEQRYLNLFEIKFIRVILGMMFRTEIKMSTFVGTEGTLARYVDKKKSRRFGLV